MIQANELRVGNWVYYLGGVYNVWAIDKLNVDLDSELYDKHLNDVAQTDIEPIPLTPEILEKCGFEKDRNGFALPDKMSLSFSVTKELGYMACWEDKSLHLPYDIKYLHQLQNLYFALTGEELTIKL